jgi:hypothetical protein
VEVEQQLAAGGFHTPRHVERIGQVVDDDVLAIGVDEQTKAEPVHAVIREHVDGVARLPGVAVEGAVLLENREGGDVGAGHEGRRLNAWRLQADCEQHQGDCRGRS